METGLLLIRVVLGGIMMAHGAQKLVGWFGGPGLAGTGGWLEAMGLRPGRMWAAVNGLAEFGGGALLVLGLITPLGSAAVAGVMLVAITTVHWRNGFLNSNGGYEFNLLSHAPHLPVPLRNRVCRAFYSGRVMVATRPASIWVQRTERASALDALRTMHPQYAAVPPPGPAIRDRR